MKHRCSWCGTEHLLDPACDVAWKANDEEQARRITKLKATNAKQAKEIQRMREIHVQQRDTIESQKRRIEEVWDGTDR